MVGANDSDSGRLHLSFRGREQVNSLKQSKKSVSRVCNNLDRQKQRSMFKFTGNLVVFRDLTEDSRCYWCK